jgi:hypothetical protein
VKKLLSLNQALQEYNKWRSAGRILVAINAKQWNAMEMLQMSGPIAAELLETNSRIQLTDKTQYE